MFFWSTFEILRPIQTERKRNFSLMFVVFSLILFVFFVSLLFLLGAIGPLTFLVDIWVFCPQASQDSKGLICVTMFINVVFLRNRFYSFCLFFFSLVVQPK